MNAPRLLRALQCQPVDRVPIWLMRQAGRYLPEYRALRAQHSILELARDARLAAEVTMMPLRRFDLDAAIIFADILLPLSTLGVAFRFAEGEGPVIETRIEEPRDVDRLDVADPRAAVAPTLEAISRVRAVLPQDKALIGFAGAPFTLASYLTEGGSSRDCARTKTFMFRHPEAWDRLMQALRSVALEALAAQIAAGADAVQLFDSWVGTLAPDDCRAFVLPHIRFIIRELKARHAGTPVILFGTGTATLLPAMAEAGADAISVDWRVPLRDAGAIVGAGTALQGNLDPALLAAGPMERLRETTRAVVSEGSRHPGYVFNLGHGVLPHTPVEHVAVVVEEVRRYEPGRGQRT
ncbi:MAG: uroporphyrinogen decarboxylase [Gemmatimonadetes bacterium]|nr:uroporphyrinogen decarboxylase [Gemmatimonadota bacterium]